jgi:hypothetical protein
MNHVRHTGKCTTVAVVHPLDDVKRVGDLAIGAPRGIGVAREDSGRF